MTFFDTNVLVYATIDQGKERLALCEKKIEEAIVNELFAISPLVMSEYIFILSKLKILERHHDDVMLYAKYIQGSFDEALLLSAYDLCKEIDFCKNINDVIHMKTAEEYCQKLLTFDSDFSKLQPYTAMKIEILR